MNGIVQIRFLKFFLLSKALLPYNRTLLSLSWLSDGRDLSVFIKSFIKISRISLKSWHHRKKHNVASALMLQEHNGFKVSSKLCWNLCLRKWLSPNLNLVSNFILGHEYWRFYFIRSNKIWQTFMETFVR